MIKSQKMGDDIEIYYLLVKKGFTVKLQIFNTSIDYIVFASSHFPPHNRLTVRATHKNKCKCARLAIKHIYQSIKE